MFVDNLYLILDLETNKDHNIYIVIDRFMRLSNYSIQKLLNQGLNHSRRTSRTFSKNYAEFTATRPSNLLLHLSHAQELWDFPDLIYDDSIYESYPQYREHYLYTVIIPILKMFLL